MSRIAYTPRIMVEPEPRRAFRTQDIRDAIEAQAGCCAMCRKPLIGTHHADHILPRDLYGETTRANLQILDTACHAEKTKKDRELIDRARALRKSEAGEGRIKRGIVSRGFDKTKTRGFDGRVRERGADNAD